MIGRRCPQTRTDLDQHLRQVACDSAVLPRVADRGAIASGFAVADHTASRLAQARPGEAVEALSAGGLTRPSRHGPLGVEQHPE
jgi:hypothetical protein